MHLAGNLVSFLTLQLL